MFFGKNEGPARPNTVPAEAVWVKDDNEWELGERNGDKKVGLWKWWLAPTGHLVCESHFSDAGELISYERFHPDGSLSKKGTFAGGVEHGITQTYRCDVETEEKAFPYGRVAENVWRVDFTFDEGNVVAITCYLRDGRECSQGGVPLVAERPANVHEKAEWDPEEGVWEHGERTPWRSKTGVWTTWDDQGRVRVQNEFDDGTIVENREFHEDGSQAGHRKFIDGIMVYRSEHRGPDGDGIHPSIDEKVMRAEYLMNRHGYTIEFRFYDAAGNIIESEKTRRSFWGMTDQSEPATREAFSAEWNGGGRTFMSGINAWLDELNNSEDGPSSPEPTDEREHLEFAAVSLLEQLNVEKCPNIRDVIMPSFEPISRPFWDQIPKSLDQLIVIGENDFLIRVDKKNVFRVTGDNFAPFDGIFAVGACINRKLFAYAVEDRIVVQQDVTGTPLYEVQYPRELVVMGKKVNNPYYNHPRSMGIKSLTPLPQEQGVVMASEEGTWLLRPGVNPQLLFPTYPELAGLLEDHEDGDEFSCGINLPTATISPDGKKIFCGGFMRPGHFAELRVWQHRGDWTLTHSSGDQAFFPGPVAVHPSTGAIAFAATMYASLNNQIANTIFRLDADKLAGAGQIDEFSGGVMGEMGVPHAMVAHKDGFICGFNNGYLRRGSATENMACGDYVFAGGSVTALDLAPNGEDIYMATGSGWIVRLSPSNQREPNMITNLNIKDAGRWLFWNTFSPMRW